MCVCVSKSEPAISLYKSLIYTYIIVRFSMASASMSATRVLEIGLPIKYAAEVVEEAEDISPGWFTDCGSSIARGGRGEVLD